ncbi:MAG TPA: crosslink repair DNA glycosylase YcaQ family protein [Longimicrobium sp.]|nr:crosslink repair DNA glycosylase YcaQ family protein [Longimicrobium sp.]
MTAAPGLDRLRAWSCRRQLLADPVDDPMDALRGVIAVYSSHPSAPLSLLARSRGFGAEWLGDAEARREVVRLSGPRGSIHLMPADTAPRIFATVRLPLDKFAGNLAYAKIERAEYDALKRRMPEILREPMTPAEAQEAFGMGANLMTALRVMAYEGLVLRLGGSLRTDVLRYVSAEAWLGAPLDEPDADESLRWLAMEYLRAFGPARIKDVAWWMGASQKRAAEALKDADTVDVGGGMLLPADQAAAFDSVDAIDPDAVALLPKWDAYTMGYAPDGRQRFVADEHLPFAYSKAKTGGAGATSGDGNPLLLRGGRAVATWSHKFAGDKLTVDVTPFAPRALASLPLDPLFDRIGRLLSAKSVTVRTTEPAG